MPNPLTPLSRWKVFDNLRRSLVEVSQLALFIAGLTVLPGSPLADVLRLNGQAGTLATTELRAEWAENTGDNPDDYGGLSEDDWAVGVGVVGAAELVAL